MKPFTQWAVWIAAAASLAAASDAGGIRAPVAGFVLDRRVGSIRAIEGPPGAALRLPFAVDLPAIAARRDYALVRPASVDIPVLARGLRAGSLETVALSGAIVASAILIAGDGAAALLCSGATRQLQFVEGLPHAPRALDAAGATALLAPPDGWTCRFRRGPEPPVGITRLRGVRSLSMLPGRDAALAASAETGEVLLLEGLSGALSARSIQALDRRTAGVLSADGRLAALDLDTGALDWIPRVADADAFEPLDRSLFVLNRAGRASAAARRQRPLSLVRAARSPSSPAARNCQEHRPRGGPA